MYHLQLHGRSPKDVDSVFLWNTETTSLLKEYVKSQQDGKGTSDSKVQPKVTGMYNFTWSKMCPVK
jgi:hypothetical protein